MSELRRSSTCPCCHGTGRQSTETEDMALACSMRELRINANISGRQMARKLKVNEAYISMLESGKRRFTLTLLEEYRKVCSPGKPIGSFMPVRNKDGTAA